MNLSTVNRVIEQFEIKAKGPKQLSQEWFKLREKGTRKRGRLGGSDMASLLDWNPYRSRKELMQEKQGIKKRKFGQAFPMVFGTVFEEVAVLSFEKTFNTKVHCKNISIVDPKGFDYMIFSPDGLCSLPVKDNKIFLEYENEEYSKIKEFVPVLIEIKCPTKRELTQEVNVPKYYIPQMQAGLLAIDIAHSALFIDNQFRACSYEHLYTEKEFNNTAKYSVHSKCRPINEAAVPIHIGAILLYGELPSNINKNYLKIEEIGGKKVYDIGNASFYTFTDMLQHIRDENIRTEYLTPYDSIDDIDIVDRIKDSKEEYISIICWKLFDVTYTLVNKNREVIQKIVSELGKYHGGEYDMPADQEIKVSEMIKKNTLIPTAPNLSFDSDDD